MNLVKMTAAEFAAYLETAIQEYADEKVTAGTWQEAESLTLAKETFANLLPQGLATPDSYLFSIYSETIPTALGMIWVKVTNQKAFIYDFAIQPAYQGKGYGKQTLVLIEEWAMAHQLTEIGLHVFAHNQTAYGLYKKMGYLETDITLVRRLAR